MQIRLMFFATLALAMFGLRTCGGNTNQQATIEKAAANCSMTISGAISAAMPCMAIGANLSTVNQSSVSITAISPTGGVATATITLVIDGSLMSKTYTDATTSQYGAIVSGPFSQGQVPKTWMAAPNPKQGSVSVTVAHFGSLITASGATEYTVHGTANATLQPQAASGATGNVTMSVTF